MKNRRIFFISDTHFDHDAIIKYCGRPFRDSKEMNKKIIQNYNYLVQPHDIVYFLGDLGFTNVKKCRETIQQLKGIKILVMGNHDRWGITSYYNMGFTAVLQEATIRLGQQVVTLGHYPRRGIKELIRLSWLYFMNPKKVNQSIRQRFARLRKEWKQHKAPTKQWHICGHVHEKWKTRGRNINVSVEQWNFKPVTANAILKIIQRGVK